MLKLGTRGKKLAGACLTAAAGMLVISGCSSNASPTASSTGGAAGCTTPTEITWLGTIKIEIQDQFKAAIADYNSTNTDCVHVTIVESPQNQPFLQTITPMYESGKAPTIMYTLQEIPDVADKVMDWTGQPLAALALPGTLDAGNVNGKQAGIPSTVEAFGMLYNKAVLDAAGVDPSAIHTRNDLAAAFDKVKASGPAAVHFTGLWWSLGAHFTNIYHTDAAPTRDARHAILDQLKAGSKDLISDPVYTNWLDTFDLLKKNNIASASIADNDYDVAVNDLASGAAGFWFMGNWAEPNLLQANPSGQFGIIPVPISNDPTAYGNDSISVGVPGYMMIDKEQSTPAQRDAAIKLLTWFLTTPKGQGYWSGATADGGMNFIPVYSGFTVKPSTFMAQQIAEYVKAGKTLEWVNSAYPAGLQEAYGAAAQKYFDGKIDRPEFAKEMQAAWKQ